MTEPESIGAEPVEAAAVESFELLEVEAVDVVVEDDDEVVEAETELSLVGATSGSTRVDVVLPEAGGIFAERLGESEAQPERNHAAIAREILRKRIDFIIRLI